MTGASRSTSDIVFRNVSLAFPKPDGHGNVEVFRDLTLDISRGSFTVLLGPSGCGKSTLLHIMDGLLAPSRADLVEVLGRDVRTDNSVTRGIGYVFQNPRLLRWKTLRQNVHFGLRGLATQPRGRWDQLIDHYFSAVGLTAFMDFYPHQVSGGMQQRAAIIRAWVNEPRILLMDEPFSHLDEITAGELRKQLIRLWTQDQERRTIVFVTHDVHEAAMLGEQIVMFTQRPASVCFTRTVDLPWPRDSNDERVFAIERELRRALTERAGVVF